MAFSRKPFQAVIGANYGDEGKGRTVDFLARRSGLPGIGVRHNSGAQAGHTVQYGDKRHVFSHFSSASFVPGWVTALMHKFVINPVIFRREWKELEQLGVTPVVFVSEDCAVSTPLDALLNQLKEANRSADRHGSCGLGFGEAIGRGEAGAALDLHTLVYMRSEDGLWSTRIKQQEEYAREALISQDLMGDYTAKSILETVRESLFSGDFNWTAWFDDVEFMLERLKVISARDMSNMLYREHEVIFEGAQGLRLHQDSPDFPHVTRSRTGLEDIAELLNVAFLGAREVLPTYCTRTYLTRHGAGPLKNELSFAQLVEKGYHPHDATNVTNPHQGSLRYALLDPEETRQSIDDDLRRVLQAQNVSVKIPEYQIALNCCDQAPGIVYGDLVEELSPAITGWGPSGVDTKTPRNSRKVKNMGAPAPEEAVQPQQTPATKESTETQPADSSAES